MIKAHPDRDPIEFTKYICGELCKICHKNFTRVDLYSDKIVSPATDSFGHLDCFRKTKRLSPNLLIVSMPGSQQRAAASSRLNNMTEVDRKALAKSAAEARWGKKK